MSWAWSQADIQATVRDAYRLDDAEDITTVRTSFFNAASIWLSGAPFWEIAAASNLTVDDLLGIHSRVLTFVLQTLVEQGIAVLGKLLESQGRSLAPSIAQFLNTFASGCRRTRARC